MKYKPAQVKKAGVALATAASEAITLGLLDGTAEKITLCVLAGAGVYGVFAATNAPVVRDQRGALHAGVSGVMAFLVALALLLFILGKLGADTRIW